MPEESPYPTISETDESRWIDISPEKIGDQGIISKVVETQGVYQYAIESLGSWYNEGQMKMINKNTNR